ncbi:type I-U CRISPR-associated protein Csx17 [bacterium]|nr:type I-U CRISPR-associated protein Csx17 [bacterium]
MTTDRHQLPLAGCTPEPLMNYLKTLGAFRLVAEQADPSAQLFWQNGSALLNCQLNRDTLIKFFLNDYCPTPIIAPWNGGSGFYDGGTAPVEAIAASNVERLRLFRDTIQRVRSFVPKQKPKDNDKQSLLVQSRACLADEVVNWLDVCFVLGEDSVRFFPLLGTGGNDGRLDFTNNFMQRVAEVIAFDSGSAPPSDSRAWLNSALFADALITLGKSAIGQFNPGGIGGANGTQGRFEASSQVNPWDFVLMIEGALLFAGSLARRQGPTSKGRAVFPFSVESVAVGYGSSTASEETTDGSRAELWLPLWSQPTTLPETRHLFAEGRAQLGKRQAKNSVEFALAVNLLGVNRGIGSFSRYGFLKRNGLAFLAAPLGRVPVRLRPQARLLDDPVLSGWLDRWRRATSDKSRTPMRYQSALRAIDRAMFEFACRSDGDSEQSNPKWLVQILRALGRAEQTLARGLAFASDKFLRPLQQLSPEWLTQADDNSPEFRLAAALAGIRGKKDGTGALRMFLEEVQTQGSRTDWSPGSCSTVWTTGSLEHNLAAVFRRRLIEAFRSGSHDGGVPLKSARHAPLDDVILFLRGDIDDEKLADLLWGLIGINWSDYEAVKSQPKPELVAQADEERELVPFEFGVTRLLVEPLPFTTAKGWWRIDSSSNSVNHDATSDDSPGQSASASVEKRQTGELSKTDPTVFHDLAVGRIAESVTRAARRHKSDGRLVVGYRNRRRSGLKIPVASEIPPERLLAAMLFPLSNRDLTRIANTVLSPPENED